MNKPDGGPAFPRDNSQMGMSLRDYFAGQYLLGRSSLTGGEPKETAMYCYRYADAMLAERERDK